MLISTSGSAHPPAQSDLCKRHLNGARQRLVLLLQQLYFGTVHELQVRAGDPLFDPPPKVIRRVKLGGRNTPRPQAIAADSGRRIDTASAQVESRQAALDQLYADVFGAAAPPFQTPLAPPRPALAPVSGGLSDEQILEKARRSRKSGAKFAALWSGQWNNHFNSASEADSSVVFTLAFYTKDAAQIDRMFRASGLFRPKWDEKHGARTYGQTTIDKALAQVTGQYQPRRTTPASRAAPAAGDGDDPDPADDDLIPLGGRDPKTKRLVLSPKKTLPTSEAFVAEFHHHREGPTLYSYAGTLMAWRGNRFVEVEEETLRQKLQPWLHAALRYHHEEGQFRRRT